MDAPPLKFSATEGNDSLTLSLNQRCISMIKYSKTHRTVKILKLLISYVVEEKKPARCNKTLGSF